MQSTQRRYRKNDNKKIYILIGVLFFLIVIVLLINSNKKEQPQAEEELTAEEIKEIENDNIVAELQGLEERDRMEYYAGMFLNYIEAGKYEKAYDLLYDEFKQNYFPTLKSFEEYIPTVFTEMSNIEHDNIERNGDVYVLWIYITDAVNGKRDEKKEMKIVIQENDYNDFVLSFSVV